MNQAARHFVQSVLPVSTFTVATVIGICTCGSFLEQQKVQLEAAEQQQRSEKDNALVNGTSFS